MDSGVSVAMAFGAGLVSVASPCVLPLIPSYLSFISGMSYQELTAQENPAVSRGRILVHALLFIAGFTCVFAAFSVAAFYVGGVLLDRYQSWLRIGGGALIIVLGLHVAGLLRSRVLDSDRRLQLKRRPAGYLGSFAVGLAFAAGWSPCIGPILGSILIYAGTLETIYQGVGLLLAYSIGFAVPFLAAALAMNSFLGLCVRFRWVALWVRVGSGVILVAAGILLMLNRLQTALDFGAVAALLGAD